MFLSRDEFLGLASVLLNGQRTLSLYPTGHPHIQHALDDCYRRLRALLQREQQIPVVLAGNEFIIGDLQVPIVGDLLGDLAANLREVGIEKLIVLEGLRYWELQSLLRLLNLDTAAVERQGGAARVLEGEEVEHIMVGSLQIEKSDEPVGDVLIRAWEAYTNGLKIVRKIRHGVRANGRLEHIDEAKELVQDLVDVAMQQTRPLLALQALKVHDEYSFTHSINVATLTLAMARGLRLGKYEMREITLAALLHDVGKERVPGEVLRKPGSLDPDEWDLMKRHTLEGAKMLAATPGTGDLALVVAYEHHLTQGPDGASPSRWPLHLASQLVMIADIYDALRSTRPYRGALPPDKTLEIMEEETGTKLQRDLFHGFTRMIGYYPPGSCIELEGGELAIVVQTNPDELRQPHVLVVRDAAGRPLQTPRRIDLSERRNGRFTSLVARFVDSEEVGLDPFDYL